MRPSSDSAGQAGRFGLVGLINGAIDFSLFSALRAFGVGLIASNVASVTVAMAFSFVANRRFVFRVGGADWRRQAVLFFAGTAFSMYVLQSLVMLACTRHLPAPLDAAEAMARLLRIDGPTAIVLVRSNAAKVLATIVSLTFNFGFYRWAVFRSPEPRGARPT